MSYGAALRVPCVLHRTSDHEDSKSGHCPFRQSPSFQNPEEPCNADTLKRFRLVGEDHRWASSQAEVVNSLAVRMQRISERTKKGLPEAVASVHRSFVGRLTEVIEHVPNVPTHIASAPRRLFMGEVRFDAWSQHGRDDCTKEASQACGHLQRS